ncbi:uncharacterized protein LOC106137895 isoform X2 [Amyelois transitella]|uniref:uncharacterized protein LOC106137895 isoform X2 n=1 Tax=Amyelois transitella TaxID=680683 RepID=UPI00298F8131|nr:uncharacterized protein LOC106137895 isoform X2 [Amyelois transitella]
MLPFLISKTKLLPIIKYKDKKSKEKSFFVTGDNLVTPKLKKTKRKPLKLLPIVPPPSPCDCTLMHLTKIVINYAPKSRKRIASNIVLSMTAWGTTGQRKRMKLPAIRLPKKVVIREKQLMHDTEDFFRKLENQLKALNLGKVPKIKNNKADVPTSQRSKGKESNEGSEAALANLDDAGEGRRRGKRRRKGRQPSDRLTSAGLAAQAQQDPETQIAGIRSDSKNPSSRGSIAIPDDDEITVLPFIKSGAPRKNDSFLDDDILKYLHREVDEDAIETEFDTKRRYVLEEAYRTRPDRPLGPEMQDLLKEMKVSAVSLGDWLHIPRVFSRQNAQFTLPIDSYALETLTPMNYAARFVSLKKSKQLLYLTVLRKFRSRSYRMPIERIEEGLLLMMGGILTEERVKHFKAIMDWDSYVEEDNIPDDIKLTLLDSGFKYERPITKEGDPEESDANTIKYRTWCGLCAICERMYGRFPPRDKDPPDGMELSDFTMIETKLAVLKVNKGLVEILNTIRER